MDNGKPIGKCYKCGANLYATLGLCLSCENKQLCESLEVADKKIEEQASALAKKFGEVCQNIFNKLYPELQAKIEQQQTCITDVLGLLKRAELCVRPPTSLCSKAHEFLVDAIAKAEELLGKEGE